MEPNKAFLKMTVSPLGLRALSYRDNKLKGVEARRPFLTEPERLELKRMELECVLAGQLSIRNIYKSFREEALLI